MGCWSADGAAIVITNPARLSREVLPRFFKHNKLGTFTQQLYTYGFTRRGNDSPFATQVHNRTSFAFAPSRPSS